MTDVKGSRREASARETRRAVVAAATELFVELGWAGTTVDQVAARAGVSRPTVFAVGSKAALLSLARDVAMAGDDKPVAVSERNSAQRVLAEGDPHRCCRLLAAHVAGVQERYGPLDEVLHRAAGAAPELAERWRASEGQRRRGAELFVGHLRTRAPVREEAVDVLWLLMAPDLRTRLVRDAGWSDDAYVDWLAATVERLLLA